MGQHPLSFFIQPQISTCLDLMEEVKELKKKSKTYRQFRRAVGIDKTRVDLLIE